MNDKTTLHAEVERVIEGANHIARLMGCRFVLSEWKLRSAGADDAVIARLRATREVAP